MPFDHRILLANRFAYLGDETTAAEEPSIPATAVVRFDAAAADTTAAPSYVDSIIAAQQEQQAGLVRQAAADRAAGVNVAGPSAGDVALGIFDKVLTTGGQVAGQVLPSIFGKPAPKPQAQAPASSGIGSGTLLLVAVAGVGIYFFSRRRKR